MIDSTKSPTPQWQRYGVAALTTVLIVVIGFMVWTKELHKSAAGNPAPTPSVVAPVRSVPSHPVATSTTIPGGIAVSDRDPFAQ